MESIGLWYQIIAPFNNSKGPCQLKKVWPIPENITGIVLKHKIRLIHNLSSFDLRNSCEEQKIQKNGIQLKSPIQEEFLSSTSL